MADEMACPECGQPLKYLHRFGEIYVYDCPMHGAVAQWPSGAVTLMAQPAIPDLSMAGKLKQRWSRFKSSLLG
jgi:hypothetical protein